MDGDLQHAPEDLPVLLDKLDEGYDVVSGWRERRADNYWTRRLPSRIANWLIAKSSGVQLRDFGTTFKAYRSSVIKQIGLYGDLHRFIPALASAQGARIQAGVLLVGLGVLAEILTRLYFDGRRRRIYTVERVRDEPFRAPAGRPMRSTSHRDVRPS